MLRKGNDAKNPLILSFFFVTTRTQLNAAHVWTFDKGLIKDLSV